MSSAATPAQQPPAPAAAEAAAAAPAPAAAASSPSDAAAPAAGQPQAGFKQCSACNRSMHSSAFSAKQARMPAHSRKCMECIVRAGSAEAEAAAAAAAVAAVSAAAAAPALKKGKAKANTPGAIARERAAARTPGASAAAGGKGAVEPAKRAGHKKKGNGSAGLLDEDEDWFLPEAEAALVEVFRRFDSTHAQAADGAPAAEAAVPQSKLFWTREDTQRFAHATNGRPFTDDEMMEIANNLEHDDGGHLTCQGFLDLFHLQSTAHPDETWKDLGKLGYNRQLQLVKKA